MILKTTVSHHHYPYFNSCIDFGCIAIQIQKATITYGRISAKQPSYLVKTVAYVSYPTTPRTQFPQNIIFPKLSSILANMLPCSCFQNME